MTFTIILLLTLALAATQLFLFAKSYLYYQFLYPLRYRPKFKALKGRPSVHLLVASKGISNDTEKIMRAFATQQYEGSYRVTFATESTQDPGNPLFLQLAQEYDHVRHVIAGRTTKCSQKNHNLLEAMKDDFESEIFAFADADVHVGQNWLTQLVEPLNLGKNWVSTGLPSHTLTSTSLSHLIQAALTTYQAKMVMSVGAIWGGAYALWRETFDELGARELWETSVVDDISLFQLMQKNNMRHWWGDKRIKLMPVPDLELEVFTNHNSIARNTDWFVRQILYVKFHRRPIWHLAVWANFANMMIMCVAPLGLLFPSDPTIYRVGLVGLGFLMFMNVINLSLPLIRQKTDCSLFTWAKLFVFGDLVANLALLSTLFTDRLMWSGIEYQVERDGSVSKVIHPEGITTTPTSEATRPQ